MSSLRPAWATFQNPISKIFLKRQIKKSQAPMAHASNPSYSGDRDRRIEVQSQPRQIVQETLS
jgi:hypothetical protein